MDINLPETFKIYKELLEEMTKRVETSNLSEDDQTLLVADIVDSIEFINYMLRTETNHFRIMWKTKL